MARPTIFTKILLQKLEMAFSMDCTDEEACILANVSPSALYAYQKANPEFLERKRLLRHKPILKARQAVIDALENPAYAFKYLERKCRQEFGPDVSSRAGTEESEMITPEQREKLDQLLGVPS